MFEFRPDADIDMSGHALEIANPEGKSVVSESIVSSRSADEQSTCQMEIRDIIQHSKERLSAHYGDRFARLILYGSEARGDSMSGSDIDLLVLLRGSFNRLNELRAIVDVLYPLQLETDRLLSARPVALEDYESMRLQLYRNVKEEGVAV